MSASPSKIITVLAATALLAVAAFTVHHWLADEGESVVNKEKFRATTKFQINRTEVTDFFGESNSEEAVPADDWFERQIKTITSRETLLIAARNLKLGEVWKLTVEEAAARLERMTEVQQERGTEIILLHAWSDNADHAAAIANAIRRAYDERRRMLDQEHARSLREAVDKKIKLQEAALEKSRGEMFRVMREHQIVDLEHPDPIRGVERSEKQFLEPAQANTKQYQTVSGGSVEKQKLIEYKLAKRSYEAQLEQRNETAELSGYLRGN